MLIVLYKSFDLTSDECRPACDTITSWIDSPNEEVRRAVVCALCLSRPVLDYEHVAVRGWLKAPAGEIHWYASAIECSLKEKSLIGSDVLVAVLRRLLAAEEEAKHAEASASDEEKRDTASDYEMVAKEAMRVFQHFHALLAPERDDIAEAAVRSESEGHVDWRLIADTFYHCALQAAEQQVEAGRRLAALFRCGN